MPIRITGLNSGLDTEAIISALVSSYNFKTNKYKKAQTKLSWKQDAWKSLNTKIYSLYNSVGNMRFSSAYSLKKTTVSDSTKLSVTAGSSSTNGSYSVQITSIAKAGYLTGGRLEAGTKNTTKLSELGYVEEEGKEGKISLSVGENTTEFSITKDTTVQEAINKLKEAGVNASYDENNRRFYVSAKNTGANNDFVLTGINEKGAEALSKLGLNVETSMARKQYQTLAQYANINISDAVAAKKNAVDTIADLTEKNATSQKIIEYASAVEQIRAVEDGKDANDVTLLKTLAFTSNLEQSYVDADGNIYTYDEESKKYTAYINDAKVEVDEETITGSANYTKAGEKLESLAKQFGLITEDTNEEGETVQDKSAFEAYKNNINTVKNISEEASEELSQTLSEIEASDSIADIISAQEASIEANNTTIEEQNRILAENPLIKPDMTEEEITALEEKAAYAKKVLDGTSNASYNSDATRIDGEDATIYVNGAEYTGESNNFVINGLTISASAVTGTSYDPTGSTAVNVTIDTDVQGVYDKIKDFLSQYNALINEMTSLYNADSAKGYEPLTDEEKDSMSDKEVEKWEEKVKSALLRRDNTLSGVMSAMTQAMAKGVEVNGEMVYLSDFGIKTLGYLNAAKNEHNAYHIDGDEDDVSTSGKQDKLMAAIAAEPEKIVEFMQQLSKNLYDAVDQKMKSTELSSIYTVYNDKEMASEYSDYTSLISKWEEKLKDQEEYYYKKFSAMESALAKLNSQTSSISGLFGGN